MRAMALARRVAKHSKAAIIAHRTYTTWRTRRAVWRGVGQQPGELLSEQQAVRRSVDRARLVFRDYLTYAGLSERGLQGKRVLELGPGEDFGVALLFLAFGAERVMTIDKFHVEGDRDRCRQVCLLLREHLNPQERTRFDAAVGVHRGVEVNPSVLARVSGIGIEQAVTSLGGARFDLILSRAVLQEVDDPDVAFTVMDTALAPGGLFAHKVDLRDYGMFTDYGMHPLTFLTVPDRWYRWMTQGVGMPNRRLVDYYTEKMAELGYSAKLFVTHVLGSGRELIPHRDHLQYGREYGDEALALVRQVRPRLLGRYRYLSDEQLLTTGVFLVGRKAGSDATTGFAPDASG